MPNRSTKPVQEDEDLDDDDDEDTTSTDEDQDEDKDKDDKHEDEDATKGVGQEVAILDGDELQKALASGASEGAREGAYDAVVESLPELTLQVTKSVLNDSEFQRMLRSMVRTAAKKGVQDSGDDFIETKFGPLAERMDKAVGGIEEISKSLSGAATLTKGVQEAEDEAARTTPATKVVSGEVVNKALGVDNAPLPGDDVNALIAQAKGLQMEKGVSMESLTVMLSDLQFRRSPQAIAALKADIAKAAA